MNKNLEKRQVNFNNNFYNILYIVCMHIKIFIK